MVALSLRNLEGGFQTMSTKNRHMSLQDRIEIQECLSKGMTFKAIANRIGKNQTTISREVKLHLQVNRNSFARTDDVCPKLLKAPFVCNGCSKRNRSNCPYTRQVYSAKYAQKQYEETLVEARSGIALGKEEFYETEKIISEAVKKGQHIYHAIKANELPVSVATVYRHINKQYYTIGLIDLPRAVKFKPRKSAKKESIPNCLKKGRSYQDFIEYITDNPDVPIVELDTVIGRIGGKVIITLHFINCDFMIVLLLENKTALEAANKIQELKTKFNSLGTNFGDLVPVLLTDNGSEFSFVHKFENDVNGNPETKLFFCEPSSPQEKPHIEKNHTLFRDIVPSGSSFDEFTQDTVNLIFSHINSVKRKQFNGKSSFEMVSFYYSTELASVLGISQIDPKDVIQSPKLLKNIY